ncbi:hypothetical protein JOE65_002444 [Arthrobacter roseus]|nr:hypothetical protein [Arthrobacter roseus]
MGDTQEFTLSFSATNLESHAGSVSRISSHVNVSRLNAREA